MWYYAENDQQRGPVDRNDLRGNVTPSTLVWREGLADWLPAGQLPELADLFPVASPVTTTPLQPSTPTPQAAIPMAYATPPRSSPASGMAIASMVLGILGLMFMCVWGVGLVMAILAVSFGYAARARGATGTSQDAGFATAGIVMGWIPITLAAAGVAIFVLIMVGAAVMS